MTSNLVLSSDSHALRVSLPELLLQSHRQNLPGEANTVWSQRGAQMSLLADDDDVQNFLAVLDSKGETILAVDAISMKRGVKVGMRGSHAHALAPNLSVCLLDPARVERAQKRLLSALDSAGVRAFGWAPSLNFHAAATTIYLPAATSRGVVDRLLLSLECLNFGPVFTSRTHTPCDLLWCSVMFARPQLVAATVLKKAHSTTLAYVASLATMLFGDRPCQWLIESASGLRHCLHASRPSEFQSLVNLIQSSEVPTGTNVTITLSFEANTQRAAGDQPTQSPLEDAIHLLQGVVGADRLVTLDTPTNGFAPVADNFGVCQDAMGAQRGVFQSKMRAAPATIGTILLAKAPRAGEPWPLRSPNENPKTRPPLIASLEYHANGLRWLQSSSDVFALFRELPSGIWQLVGVMD